MRYQFLVSFASQSFTGSRWTEIAAGLAPGFPLAQFGSSMPMNLVGVEVGVFTNLATGVNTCILGQVGFVDIQAQPLIPQSMSLGASLMASNQTFWQPGSTGIIKPMRINNGIAINSCLVRFEASATAAVQLRIVCHLEPI